MKKSHMGDAIDILGNTEKEFLSKSVENAHLGCMSAVCVETYRRNDGVIMRMRTSNGGCTLEIDDEKKI